MPRDSTGQRQVLKAGSGGEGWAGRDSSHRAQLGLTGQGVLVAAILLAAAPPGAHVVLRVHGDAKESRITLAGFRTPLVAGHCQGGLCRMAMGRGLSGPWSGPLPWGVSPTLELPQPTAV